MKGKQLEYGLELDPNACYKTEYIHNQSRENFESVVNWLYLGADIRDIGYAKIGLTMGDLSTRSSSPANPNYYIFCAFKCRSNITKLQISEIEKNTLKHLESVFSHDNGSTKRAPHADSGRMSECFYDVDFIEVFTELHNYIYDNYANYFNLAVFETYPGITDGEYVYCQFNDRISLDETNRYIRMILQN